MPPLGSNELTMWTRHSLEARFTIHRVQNAFLPTGVWVPQFTTHALCLYGPHVYNLIKLGLLRKGPIFWLHQYWWEDKPPAQWSSEPLPVNFTTHFKIPGPNEARHGTCMKMVFCGFFFFYAILVMLDILISEAAAASGQGIQKHFHLSIISPFLPKHVHFYSVLTSLPN